MRTLVVKYLDGTEEEVKCFEWILHEENLLVYDQSAAESGKALREIIPLHGVKKMEVKRL